MNRKASKLRERLGEKTWLKPKGLHKETFDRLRARLIDAEMMADEILERVELACEKLGSMRLL